MNINTINYLIVMLKNYLKQARMSEKDRKRERARASRAALYRAYIHTYIDWANPEPTRPKTKTKQKKNKHNTSHGVPRAVFLKANNIYSI